MKNRKIVKANACYTGGGIYVFYAEYSDGLFGMTSSEDENIYIVDEYPDIETAWYPEWMEEHMKEIISGKAFSKAYKDLLKWIIKNEPDGNYQAGELEWLMIE